MLSFVQHELAEVSQEGFTDILSKDSKVIICALTLWCGFVSDVPFWIIFLCEGTGISAFVDNCGEQRWNYFWERQHSHTRHSGALSRVFVFVSLNCIWLWINFCIWHQEYLLLLFDIPGEWERISNCLNEIRVRGMLPHYSFFHRLSVLPPLSQLTTCIIYFLLYKETSQFFEHCSHNSLKVFANTSLQSVDNALMHLSSTSFELDDLDQEDQDSLDSWVHHLLIAVDHVSTPLFSLLCFLLLHLFGCFLMFVRLLRTSNSFCFPSCTPKAWSLTPLRILRTQLLHALKPLLVTSCFRAFLHAFEESLALRIEVLNERMLFCLLHTHIQIISDRDENFVLSLSPCSQHSDAISIFRDAGCPSQRSPVYAAWGSPARALCPQNRLPPLNFVSRGPLPWVIRSRAADFDDA